MEENKLITNTKRILNNNIIKIIISNPCNSEIKIKKITIELRNDNYYVSEYTEKQVFNLNLTKEELENYLEEKNAEYGQYNFWDENNEYMLKKSKKGKVLYKKIALNTPLQIVNENHNNIKNYILKENTIIEPLIDMGIFTKEGKIINSMYDKYKQINRFLEIIDDSIKEKHFEELNVIDFGCGKSYLTFILYYYLKEIKKINVSIVGLDLKENVINNCNEIAKKYNYENLKFELGNISDYKTNKKIDMVVTLHACDTATDYALYNAIKWNTKMIFSVPCCQHELNSQIQSEKLNIITRYGIAKERISALYTDIIRCNLLESMSYKTQLLEFVDFENTPKNLLIRATLTNVSKDIRKKRYEEVKSLTEEFDLKPKLEELILQDDELKKDLYE